MNKISRRTMARYAVDQLKAGKSARQVAQELAATAAESGQIIEPEFLLGDIAWELERRHELTVGQVTSARSLDDRTRAELTNEIKKATNSKDVLLEEKVDPSLIGGLRIETAAKVWDFSVARKLAQLKEIFNG